MKKAKGINALLDEVEDVKKSLENLKALSESERDYIFRKFDMSLSAEYDKEDTSWTLKGKLILTVSEDSEENSDVYKTIPLEVGVKDADFNSALGMATSSLYILPAKYGDAIFEDNFFDLLDRYADLEKEIQKLEQRKSDDTFVTGLDSDTIVQ